MSTLSEVLCYNCYRRQGCKLKDLIEDVNGVIHFTGAISWNTAVLPHGAVIAQTQQLVNCGDFVKLATDQVWYLLILLQASHDYCTSR